MKKILLLVCTSLAACTANKPPANNPAARGPLEAPRVTAGDLDAKALLAELPARAITLGAGPVSVVHGGEAVEGERMGAFVEVPTDLCLLAYARAAQSIEDLDVAVFSDEGAPLAVDEAPDAHPTVLLCPPHPARVYVAAHVASGEGLVAVGVQHVPKERAPTVARALGARGSAGEAPRPAEAWPGLDDEVRAHRAAMGGKWEEIRKVALSVDARAPTMVSFPIEPDQCTDAVIVPGEEVSLLEVEALDAEGRVVARAREGGRNRTLTVCSPLALGGTLSIRPHGGRGLAAVVLSRARGEVARDLAARADVAWAAPARSADEARQARDRELSKAGYDAASQVASGTLVLGRRGTVTLDPLKGPAGCARIDLVAGAPLALVAAALWDDQQSLVAAADGAASVTLFGCAKGPLRLDLETRGRPGPFVVTVRPEPWKDPAFAASPLAAARMLARAGEGPGQVLGGSPLGVRAFSVDATKLQAWPQTVPAGRCLRVAAGAQGEGTGVELRVFDGQGAELDRAHGAHAASVRVCADDVGARPVRVELRVTAGRLDLVVGERLRGAVGP